VSAGLRYFGGGLAFGFAAVWIMASLAAALVCLAATAVGYGVGFAVERMRAKPGRASPGSKVSTPTKAPQPRRATGVDELPRWAEALNSDLGHVYEPAAATAPLSAEAAYGWPVDDDTALPSETLQ
jgi:hypothetical protein